MDAATPLPARSARAAARAGSLPGTSRLGRYTLIAFAWFFTFLAISPFAFAFVTSFKTQADSIDGTVIPFVQFQPTLINWQQEIGGTGGQDTAKSLRNSTLISLGATLISTTLGTLAGYGLARFKYGIGNRNLVSWFLSQRFLPPIATVIPYMLFFRDFKLTDTLQGMVLVNATFTLPFAVLIMRDFFADFPQELVEAALVDGAGHFGTFWRIALPLSTPALVASIIICFSFAWNEYLFAVTLTNRDWKPYPLLVAGSDSVRGIMFGFVTTRMLIAVTIPVLLSLLVQRYIVRGLTMGAVKG